MKMVMVVVPRDEARRVLDALISAGFAATFTESRGGMLRQAQYLLFIAVKDEDVERVLRIVDRSCHSEVTVESSETEEPAQAPVKAELGGAAVFVWDLEQFKTF